MYNNTTDLEYTSTVVTTVLVSVGICVCLIAIPAVIVGVCIAVKRKTKRTGQMARADVNEPPIIRREDTVIGAPIQVSASTDNLPTAAVTDFDSLAQLPTVNATVAMPPVSLEDMNALPVAFAQPL